VGDDLDPGRRLAAGIEPGQHEPDLRIGARRAERAGERTEVLVQDVDLAADQRGRDVADPVGPLDHVEHDLDHDLPVILVDGVDDRALERAVGGGERERIAEIDRRRGIAAAARAALLELGRGVIRRAGREHARAGADAAVGAVVGTIRSGGRRGGHSDRDREQQSTS
jgi:hypothetical protein